MSNLMKKLQHRKISSISEKEYQSNYRSKSRRLIHPRIDNQRNFMNEHNVHPEDLPSEITVFHEPIFYSHNRNFISHSLPPPIISSRGPRFGNISILESCETVLEPGIIPIPVVKFRDHIVETPTPDSIITKILKIPGIKKSYVLDHNEMRNEMRRRIPLGYRIADKIIRPPMEIEENIPISNPPFQHIEREHFVDYEPISVIRPRSRIISTPYHEIHEISPYPGFIKRSFVVSN